ncbi:hypothetical protein RRG08_036703 [Elysia crispata]|uniref:Secreted protein n=1 Tax=Elysia crispata TaxID=231223 RepID=A0AAE1CMU5_9GAST|nr:hypothetical protein RRG08_036703 [Elysia crispata]
MRRRNALASRLLLHFVPMFYLASNDKATTVQGTLRVDSIQTSWSYRLGLAPTGRSEAKLTASFTKSIETGVPTLINGCVSTMCNSISQQHHSTDQTLLRYRL